MTTSVASQAQPATKVNKTGQSGCMLCVELLTSSLLWLLKHALGRTLNSPSVLNDEEITQKTNQINSNLIGLVTRDCIEMGEKILWCI